MFAALKIRIKISFLCGHNYVYELCLSWYCSIMHNETEMLFDWGLASQTQAQISKIYL